MTLKDHSSFANKTWERFGGQVKEDKTRIWPQPKRIKEDREREQMFDISVTKKKNLHKSQK